METQRSKQLRHEFAMRQYRAQLMRRILEAPDPSKNYAEDLNLAGAILFSLFIISLAMSWWT